MCVPQSPRSLLIAQKRGAHKKAMPESASTYPVATQKNLVEICRPPGGTAKRTHFTTQRRERGAYRGEGDRNLLRKARHCKSHVLPRSDGGGAGGAVGPLGEKRNRKTTDGCV